MSENLKSFQGLVGDIGGTNARFALVSRLGGEAHLDHIIPLECRNYFDVQAALRDYFHRIGGRPELDFIVLAIAGPVKDGVIKVTNLDWTVTETDLKAATGAKTARLINDYTALAFCLPYLKIADVHMIGEPVSGFGHVHAVMGPGTGMGAAVLVGGGHHPVCLPTESGHATFAPINDFEVQIAQILRRKYGRVTNEMLLSGPGLVNIDRAISQINGEPVVERSPAEITLMTGGQIVGRPQTVETFLDILASFCGDLVLYHGATASLSIASGITPRLIPVIDAKRFRARMEAKMPMQALVSQVPARVITYGYAALLGAAHALADGELI